MGLGVGKELVGGFGISVEDGRLDELKQLRVNVCVDGQSSGIDDGHVHTLFDGVIEESAVHRLTDGLHASEGEGEVGQTTADTGQRKVLLNEINAVKELHGVGGVLLHTSTDGENVGIENDVLRREADLLSQDLVRSLADFELSGGRHGLSFFVEGHDDNSSAIAENNVGLLDKVFFTFLQADTVDDALSLYFLQTSLNYGKVRRVEHKRYTRHLRVRRQKSDELLDDCLSINHTLVEVKIEYLGSILDLLLGDIDSTFEVVLSDHSGEHSRSSNVATLTDVDKEKILGEDKRLKTRKNESWLNSRSATRNYTLDNIGKGFNMARSGTTATSYNVNEPTLGKVQNLWGHDLRALVVLAHSVRETSVRISRYVAASPVADTLQERSHLFSTQSAVQTNAKRLDVRDTGQKSLIGLT